MNHAEVRWAIFSCERLDESHPKRSDWTNVRERCKQVVANAEGATLLGEVSLMLPMPLCAPDVAYLSGCAQSHAIHYQVHLFGPAMLSFESSQKLPYQP